MIMVTFLDELIDDSDEVVATESSCKKCKESDTENVDVEDVLDDVEGDSEDDDNSAEESCKKAKCGGKKCKTAKEAYAEWVASKEDIANENFIKTAVDAIVKKFQQFCDWLHKKIMELSDENPLKKVYVKFSKRAKDDLRKAQEAKTQEEIDRLNEELSNLHKDLKEELAKLGTNKADFEKAIAQRNKKLNKFDENLAKANNAAYSAKNASDKLKDGYAKSNYHRKDMRK